LTQTTDIVHQVLQQFKELLTELSRETNRNFNLIDTQGTLVSDDWANELHPFPEGFAKIAQRFVKALRQKFPGRI